MPLSKIVPVCLLCLAISDALASEAPIARMPEHHFEFLNNYCLDCHDEITEKGNVNLEGLSFNIDTVEGAALWQKVLDVLNAGEMPPEDETQPQADEKTVFLDDLSNEIVAARKILSDTGGEITMRRLNHREYKNTIQSLLGIAVDAEELPKDANPSAFDTVGASLFFSSDQFEQYFKIARRTLEIALDEPKRYETKRTRVEAEIAANKQVGNRYNRLYDRNELGKQWKAAQHLPPSDFGFTDADRVDFEMGRFRMFGPGYEHYQSLPETESGAVFFASWDGFLVAPISIPSKSPPGKYIIRAAVGLLDTSSPDRQFIEIGTIESGARPGELAVLDHQKVESNFRTPEIIEFEITVTPTSSRKIGLRERHHNTREAARYEFRLAEDKNIPMAPPSLWVDWLEWEGPIQDSTLTPFQTRLWGDQAKASGNSEYIRDVLRRFAYDAFRQDAPSESFIDKLFKLYQGGRQAGLGMKEALLDPLAAILASPGFLYMMEPNPDEDRRELNDRELAVRLAYFLWSAPPDSELYALAKAGKLKRKAVLKKQVDRMLADPRAEEFYAGFAEQWLHMDRLDFFQFNFKLYPDFDDSAKASARREIYEMLRTTVDDDESIERLLKADYVVVNELLAEYYGIEGVKGTHFRRVPVPQDSPRGGLLGTAAVLAMGSDGERSSPVERGAWVMRKLLHDPPPPAPANVPQLSRLSDQMLSARDLQQAHMEEPQCAQCHRKIDPIGFGLENFDAAGKWRVEELIPAANKNQKDAYAPIDASGTMPNKQSFGDYFELRDRVAERGSDFARGFTEYLISYGLGRPYGFTDYDLAEEILGQARRKENQTRAFIHALVQSEAFHRK